MKIFVKVKPKAKEEKIGKIDGNHFIVWVKEPPIEGKANKAVMRILAGYFNLPMANLRITSGRGTKQKIVQINE